MWIALLFTAVVLAGPGKKRERKKVRSPTSGPMAPEGTGVAPDRLPALTGVAYTLALEGLDRTSVPYTFEQDGTVLGQIDSADALFRHLAADPRWRVSTLGGVRVATERVEQGGAFTSGPEGYHMDGGRCWRVGVRLDGEGATYPWNASGPVEGIQHTESTLAVWAYALRRGPCTDQRAVALVVEGPAISLEVLDGNLADEVHVVERVLGELPLELADLAIDPTAIERDGYDAERLGGPLPSKAMAPTLGLRPDGIEIRATVHRTDPGQAWFRILRDGSPWQEAIVVESTVEWPGWSPQEEHFWLQSRIPVQESAPFEATVELWFRPVDGTPERVWSQPARWE